MRLVRIVCFIIVFACFGCMSCSAAVPQEDLTINGIYIGMDRAQVENKIGTPRGTEKFINHVVYVYNRGQVKVIYEDNKVMRMKITDRAWENNKGLRCGGKEQDIERIYGRPNIFSDDPEEKSYIYFTENLDTLEFIAIEGYIQEIIVEKKKVY